MQLSKCKIRPLKAAAIHLQRKAKYKEMVISSIYSSLKPNGLSSTANPDRQFVTVRSFRN
jgi:hypothetical protein